MTLLTFELGLFLGKHKFTDASISAIVKEESLSESMLNVAEFFSAEGSTDTDLVESIKEILEGYGDYEPTTMAKAIEHLVMNM